VRDRYCFVAKFSTNDHSRLVLSEVNRSELKLVWGLISFSTDILNIRSAVWVLRKVGTYWLHWVLNLPAPIDFGLVLNGGAQYNKLALSHTDSTLTLKLTLALKLACFSHWLYDTGSKVSPWSSWLKCFCMELVSKSQIPPIRSLMWGHLDTLNALDTNFNFRYPLEFSVEL
jgi:hypothetical protein